MICYLCGKAILDNETTNKDHVPPSCLFPDPKPSNLITVRLHQKCNSSFSKDEEYFRADILAISDLPESKEALSVWQTVRRSHIKNRSKYLDLTSRVTPTTVRTNSGIIIGTASQLKIPKDRTKRVLAKIAKGLNYHHTETVIDDSYRMEVYFNPNEALLDLVQKAKHKGRFEGTFSYAGAVTDTKSSIWWMVFYRSVSAIVIFLREVDE